jgi:hypothetical protein
MNEFINGEKLGAGLGLSFYEGIVNGNEQKTSAK